MTGSVLSSQRRHRGYVLLLAACLFVMVCLMLPTGLRQLAALGYLALPLVLIRSLGSQQQGAAGRLGSRWRTRLYRLLALLTFGWSLVWYLATLSHSATSAPLLLLWTVLVAWSAERLIHNLTLERLINRQVLVGALAGYLLLGLAAGLLFNVVETAVPGSFISAHSQNHAVLTARGAAPTAATPVWAIDFVKLNYFAFVTLTTTGYGDIHPMTPQTQMLCVLVAMSGTVYLVVVMGLLISRATANDLVDDERERP